MRVLSQVVLKMAGKQRWNKRYEPRTSAKMHRLFLYKKFPEEIVAKAFLVSISLDSEQLLVE